MHKLVAAALVIACVIGGGIGLGYLRARVPHIGVVLPHTETTDPEYKAAFVAAMEGLGYVHGRSIKLTFSSGIAGFDERADTLAAAGVDLLVVASTPARQSACKSTQARQRPIPIVVTTIAAPDQCDGDPPGLRRVTGSTLDAMQLVGKQLEVLSAVARYDVIGVLVNPNTRRVAERYIGRLKELAPDTRFPDYQAGSLADIEKVFAQIAVQTGSARPKALMVAPDALFREYGHRIAALAIAHKLPTMFSTMSQARDGGLLAYGQSYPEAYERAAYYVHRILKGRKPEELPIEGPARIILAVNRKTADAIGVRIPPELLIRANEVFQ